MLFFHTYLNLPKNIYIIYIYIDVSLVNPDEITISLPLSIIFRAFSYPNLSTTIASATFEWPFFPFGGNPTPKADFSPEKSSTLNQSPPGWWLAIHLSPNEDGFAIFGWISYGIRILWDLPWIPKKLWDQETGFPFGRDNLWVPSWFLQVYIWTVGYLDPIYSVIECQNITWVLRASILKQLVSSVAGCFFFPLVGKWE